MKFRYLLLLVCAFALMNGCAAPSEEKAPPLTDSLRRVPESNIKVPPPSDQCLRGRAACKALGLDIRREFAPGFHEITWMYDLVYAAQAGDYKSLQQWVHPEHGFLLLHKPGVAPTFMHFAQASELAGSPWENYVVQGKKTTPKLAKEDIFMTAQYHMTPEWLENSEHGIPPITSRTDGNFTYWNNLVQALEDSEMLYVDKAVRKKIDVIGELVHMELFFNQFFYFGEIDGKWYLLALDIARSDFSA